MQLLRNGMMLVIGLTGLALFLGIWLPWSEAFRVVFGGFYILMVPGLAMTYAFFKEKELHFLERIPFGFGFSIVTVPLAVFSLNRIGVSVNAGSILAVTSGLLVLAMGIAWIRNFKNA